MVDIIKTYNFMNKIKRSYSVRGYVSPRLASIDIEKYCKEFIIFSTNKLFCDFHNIFINPLDFKWFQVFYQDIPNF